jgi:hypothetical protein
MARMNDLPPILNAIGCDLSPGLPLLPTFELPLRERVNGQVVQNQCGRDFLWLCLHRANPAKWNMFKMPPEAVSRRDLFGPSGATVAGMNICEAPAVLAAEGLELAVGVQSVGSYLDFLGATVSPWSRVAFDESLASAKDAIAKGDSCGLCLSAGAGGIMTHLLFVAGFTDRGAVVFDTHRVEGFGYTKLTPETDPRHAMLLSYEEIHARWGPFARVYTVKGR